MNSRFCPNSAPDAKRTKGELFCAENACKNDMILWALIWKTSWWPKAFLWILQPQRNCCYTNTPPLVVLVDHSQVSSMANVLKKTAFCQVYQCQYIPIRQKMISKCIKYISPSSHHALVDGIYSNYFFIKVNVL